jgi:hypothetical protein
VVQLGFAYRAGGSIPSLEASIEAAVVGRIEQEEQARAAVFA